MMKVNKLNPDKIETLLLGGSLDWFEAYLPGLQGVIISMKDCGLLNPALPMKVQISAVTKNAFYQLHRMTLLHPYLDHKCLTVIHALLISKIDNCNTF